MWKKLLVSLAFFHAVVQVYAQTRVGCVRVCVFHTHTCVCMCRHSQILIGEYTLVYVNVYVNICECKLVFLHMYIHTYIHVYTYIYIHRIFTETHICAKNSWCNCSSPRAFVGMCRCDCMQASILKYIRIFQSCLYVCVCVYLISIYTRVCIYLYTHTQTYTRIYIYIYTHIKPHRSFYVCVCICVYVCVYVCVCGCLCFCMDHIKTYRSV